MKSILRFRRPVRRDPRAGLNLIELAIVLAIVSVIIGAIWVVAGNVRENVRVYTVIRQTTELVQNVRDYYQTQNTIGKDGTATYAALTQKIASLDLFPAEMKRNADEEPTSCGSGTTCYFNNPWDKVSTSPAPVELAAVDDTGAINQGRFFRVKYVNIPNAGCIALVTRFNQVAEDIRLRRIVINAATNNVFVGGTFDPVSIDEATDQCDDSDEENTIALEFGL